MAEDNDNKPAQPKHPQQPQGNPFAQVGEVTIEISTPNCGNVLWPHPRMLLRGEWRRDSIIGVSAQPGLQKMPTIPGLRIRFNGRERTVTVYDPLTLPENATTLADVHRAYDQLFLSNAAVGSAPHAGKPEPEKVYPDQSATDLKTWLHWMRRHVDEGNARLVSGSLPSCQEISRFQGKTLVETFQSNETTKYLEDRKREPAMA